jgi:uncharacterized protein
MPVYERRSPMPVTAQELYEWHARPGAFERLSPPWQRVRVIERKGTIEDGDRLVMEARLGPVRRRWVAVHRDHVPGRQFVDEQEQGPFARWRHRHVFEPMGGGAAGSGTDSGELGGDGRSVLHDTVEYELPGPEVTARAAEGLAARRIERLFRFRHQRTHDDLERHASFAGEPRLRVVVTGASGFIGSQLEAYLTTAGHEVLKLTRRRDRGPGWVLWDPFSGVVKMEELDGVDAFVHLAGESLAGLWTSGRRKRIMESRSRGTALVVEAALSLPQPPRVIVSASAIGWYGDRGDERLTEESGPGEGFLAAVCKAWEDALEPARASGIRTVSTRFGLVWGGDGGMLPLMAPPFRFALGTRLGSGRQWMSWVAIDDLLGAVEAALHDESLSGAVNVTSPRPVTNREFTETLGKVLNRPTPFAVPRAVLERGLGEMGSDMLLTSQRVLPARLTAAGFRWLFPDLESALRFELGK